MVAAAADKLLEGLLPVKELNLMKTKLQKVERLMKDIETAKGVSLALQDNKYCQYEKKSEEYQAKITKHENAMLMKNKIENERKEEMRKLAEKKKAERDTAKQIATLGLRKRHDELERDGEDLLGRSTHQSREEKALKDAEQQAAKAKAAIARLQSGEASPVAKPQKMSTSVKSLEVLKKELRKVELMLQRVEVGTKKHDEFTKQKEELEKEVVAKTQDEMLLKSPEPLFSPTPDFQPVDFGSAAPTLTMNLF